MITEIEDFFTKGCGRCDRFATADCSVRAWQRGLTELRTLCLAAGLTETVKWGHPCYTHSARNIAIIGAFRGDFRLSFFNAALMKDPEGVLERQGPNTRHADMIRFTENEQVADKARVIAAYLTEAMGYAEAGVKPPKDDTARELPEELTLAMDADPDLAEAFHALTPGRQTSYVIHLASARTSATRVARIARARPKIMAGKGANER
ncbi:hypothetical protein GVY41_06690 [Frigidibacter albus]|uniref:YdhG-like domain-containing protein n=1 Tax=Frigidibacter albus TaxID=1465486 RepID=A0A6L8VGQ3_9RHOB|nr:DUF1801 domain-containing protein [Frigidibacter albus]MZQ88499.1 hypothetical protein [Frigidibacter albus]NBE30692.1 hypothetical protein [Frigidibacter albus]GGH48703.1 hypothetical protein GCM10011341_10530 [Frigidibacter albus]